MQLNKKLVFAVVGLVVVVFLVLLFSGTLPFKLGSFGRSYQAVFLNNGQVYFGKLSNARGQYPVLREVYYLQVTQAPQPIQPGEQPPTNINVVKLGGELHGPTDEMRINRDAVLFIEDMKSDSRVAQAIEQFKAQNK